MVQKPGCRVFERAFDQGDERVVGGERGGVEDYVEGRPSETPDDAGGAGMEGVGWGWVGRGGGGVAVVGDAGVVVSGKSVDWGIGRGGGDLRAGGCVGEIGAEGSSDG